MLVSVIIPIYNIENYVEKCVNSVLAQTYQNIEIILVDDGSTDASGEICDNFRKQDSRIRVIHKMNGGQTSARKAGIGVSTGRYILFVDGDDWIEENMISDLINLAVSENADVVTSGTIVENGYGNVSVTDSLKEGLYADDKEREYLYSHMMFNESAEIQGVVASLWNKLFRRELIKETIENQSEIIKNGEDAALTYRSLLKANRIMITHNIYYHYVIRLDSVTHTTDEHYLNGVNELYLCLKEEVKDSPYYSLLGKQIEVFLIRCLFQGINEYIGIQKENQIPYYMFDEYVFAPESKIVIYGAGKIGQSYYSQLERSERLRVAGWIDSNFQEYREKGMDVSGIAHIQYLEYDYILIAIKNENAALAIRDHLVGLGIETEKIIWNAPQNIIDKYIKL